jgi:hypothetical protein
MTISNCLPFGLAKLKKRPTSNCHHLMIIISIEKNPRQELLSLILHDSNKNEKPQLIIQTVGYIKCVAKRHKGKNKTLELTWN